jgi:isocitrate dehydrogenase
LIFLFGLLRNQEVSITDQKESIQYTDEGNLFVPDFPVIPFIEGYGIGPDIWRETRQVIDVAVLSSYGCKRGIEWLEILA